MSVLDTQADSRYFLLHRKLELRPGLELTNTIKDVKI